MRIRSRSNPGRIIILLMTSSGLLATLALAQTCPTNQPDGYSCCNSIAPPCTGTPACSQWSQTINGTVVHTTPCPDGSGQLGISYDETPVAQAWFNCTFDGVHSGGCSYEFRICSRATIYYSYSYNSFVSCGTANLSYCHAVMPCFDCTKKQLVDYTPTPPGG